MPAIEAHLVAGMNYICTVDDLPACSGIYRIKNLAVMKYIKNITKCALILCVSALLIISCSKEPAGNDYTYFVSKEHAVTYNLDYINNIMNVASADYPGLNQLKDQISFNVDVFRIVYKTTIDDEKIEASGLVCVPREAGDYPVLCFQNGTNTVNAYAPSEFPINTLYQMIEIVASTGYIVVIPDYPGFGSSSQIPHPYLIAEPTVTSIIDMLFAVNEMDERELPDIKVLNEYYIAGYSQGGWATLALHKTIEEEYPDVFNLRGSVCGAGPYDLSLLFNNMISVSTYPMPVYIGYIINAYKAYNQFTNPVSDILKEQYASKLENLYTGELTSDQINSQLTTSIADLINADFLSGFATVEKYSSVRQALSVNSIEPWDTDIPLLLIHGGSDTQVNPVTTADMYDGMIGAGTSTSICTKEILPGLDHGDGIVPCMVKGLLFLSDLRDI